MDPKKFFIVPYAGKTGNLTVSQAILAYLKIEGVNTIFGIPGGGIADLINELRIHNKEFTYVVCRQETGAAFAADGYHRATGKLGVVLVTSGPGATNALTGLMNAQASGSALLAITGEVPEQFFGKGYLQEGMDAKLNINEVYHSAVGYTAVITEPTNFQALFTQALRYAMSDPRGTSHISLPVDASKEKITHLQLPDSPEEYRTRLHASNPDQVRKALETLLSLKTPLIWIGNGTRYALQGERLKKFIAFVERFHIPVMTTPEGKGLFPESHPLSLRNYGMAESTWPKMYIAPENGEQYEGVMVIGSPLNELTTNKWNEVVIPTKAFIQVDPSQSIIGRVFPITQGIVANLELFFDQLSEISHEFEPNEKDIQYRRALLKDIKQHSPYLHPEKMHSNAVPILPQSLMGALNEMLPREDCQVISDGGNCIGWMLHYLNIDPSNQIHFTLAMGPMGFGNGAVVGAKMGSPKKTSICITGDGGFMMNGAEISTAKQYGLGAIWIVLNDNDLGMVSQGQAHFFPANGGWKDYYQIGKPDLKLFAEGLGAEAYAIHSLGEFKEAFQKALKGSKKNRPQVIIAHINTDEIPPYYTGQ